MLRFISEVLKYEPFIIVSVVNILTIPLCFWFTNYLEVHFFFRILFLYWNRGDWFKCCISFRYTADVIRSYTFIYKFFKFSHWNYYRDKVPCMYLGHFCLPILYSSVYMLIPNTFNLSPSFPFGNLMFVFVVCESVL